ncbi:hypothetical protein MMC26_004669 [Xylographa opegraphella]|nr:hypothetical protein [Xylographa opegraphella]
MPFNYMFPLRAAQFIFAVIMLGLTGYVAHWYIVRDGISSPSQINFLIFASLWTLFTVPYLTIAPVYFPKLTHKYATLATDALTMLFWFAGFVALAVFLSALSLCLGSVCGSAKAAAAFGAFIWIISSVTTGLAAMHVWRTRHSAPAKPAPSMERRPGV